MNLNAVLCYVENDKAFFTTCPLDKQWGDDWGDAPYEHNAGWPYDWSPYMKEGGIDAYEVFYLPFSGPFETPEQASKANGSRSSPYSVEMINNKNVPWIKNHEWYYEGEPIYIYAGVSLSEFITLIKKGGGTVYQPID